LRMKTVSRRADRREGGKARAQGGKNRQKKIRSGDMNMPAAQTVQKHKIHEGPRRKEEKGEEKEETLIHQFTSSTPAVAAPPQKGVDQGRACKPRGSDVVGGRTKRFHVISKEGRGTQRTSMEHIEVRTACVKNTTKDKTDPEPQ